MDCQNLILLNEKWHRSDYLSTCCYQCGKFVTFSIFLAEDNR